MFLGLAPRFWQDFASTAVNYGCTTSLNFTRTVSIMVEDKTMLLPENNLAAVYSSALLFEPVLCILREISETGVVCWNALFPIHLITVDCAIEDM